MMLKQNFIVVFIPFLDLGESCSEAGDLDYIDRGECRGNLTRCKAPYIVVQNNRECRIGEFQTTDVILIVVLPCILISTKLFFQQMHILLKHKMLQFIFKISFLIWLLHVSVSSDHHQGAYGRTLLKLLSL